MIFTDRTVIVQKGTSSINDTIVLYRGDKDVEIRFTLNEGSPFRFGSGTSSNIIEKTEATYGQLVIKTPGALPPIFSEVMPTVGGKIIFTITAEMIDEITEVGNYTFQIRLLDENRGSRATLPEVKNGIEIREPIASEDTTNEVGIATVGYALTTAATPEDAFDTQGNYNKTTWGTGDRITATKLNKIEDGIYEAHNKINVINNKVEENTTNTNTAKQDINDIKLQIGTEELTTTSKKLKGAINELGSQIKEMKGNKIQLQNSNDTYEYNNNNTIKKITQTCNDIVNTIIFEYHDNTEIIKNITESNGINTIITTFSYEGIIESSNNLISAWEIGNLKESNGDVYNDGLGIRTPDFIEFGNKTINLNVENGYRIRVFIYELDGTYSGVERYTANTEFVCSADKKYKINAHVHPNDNVPVTDVTTISNHVSVTEITKDYSNARISSVNRVVS